MRREFRQDRSGRTGGAPALSALTMALNSASFFAPLTSSLALVKGTGTATFTRATTATVVDFEGNVRLCQAGEARFTAARRVENLCLLPKTITSWVTFGTIVSATNNTVLAPDGTLTGGTLNIGANVVAGAYYLTSAGVAPIGCSLTHSVYLRASTPGYITIQSAFTGAANRTCYVTTEWKRFYIYDPSTTNAQDGLRINRALSSQITTVDVWGAMTENNSSASNKNPQEFGVTPTFFSTRESTTPKLISYGDSLTAYFARDEYSSRLASLLSWTCPSIKGVSGETSTQIATRFLADVSVQSGYVVIWAGRNDYNAPLTVKANIAAMVAFLGHTNYLVVGIPNGEFATEYVGQPAYAQIVQLNTDLAAIYGVRFVDVLPVLVSSYNPSIPQDVIDFTHGIVPSSLRFDTLHPNYLGMDIIAATVMASAVNLGWDALTKTTPYTALNTSYMYETTATNLFLNSAVGVTQTTPTLTAASYTLSFKGTGSIVGTGGFIGTLAGTGATNRVSLTVTASALAAVLTVTGSCTEVQLERGSFATSYIPTTATPVIRNTDVITYPSAGNLTSAQGSVYVEWIPAGNLSAGAHNIMLTLVDGANLTRLIYSLGIFYVQKYIAGVLYASTLTLTAVAGTKYKLAFTYGANGVRLCARGVMGTPNANALPAAIGTTITLGCQQGTEYGALRSVNFWPRQLTDAQLVTITS